MHACVCVFRRVVKGRDSPVKSCDAHLTKNQTTVSRPCTDMIMMYICVTTVASSVQERGEGKGEEGRCKAQ